jgi:hypothetical protein
MHEESRNDRRSQWLTGSGGRRWLTSATGKIGKKGKEGSSPRGFYSRRRERDRDCGPARRHQGTVSPPKIPNFGM